uniref:Uncharacterized protein n=1 Tax=Arundo donax TaxID=35708 RepID=A0A0A9C2L2_ARUDO
MLSWFLRHFVPSNYGSSDPSVPLELPKCLTLAISYQVLELLWMDRKLVQCLHGRSEGQSGPFGGSWG